MRYLFLTISLLFCPVQSWACSCSPWAGGYASEFSQSYDSFWVTPIEGRLELRDSNRPGLIVKYSLEVLEGFDQLLDTRVSAVSNIADGASCGIELTLGLPQFISAYKLENESYGLSSCTPFLPYETLKLYLSSGEDTYIPAWSECYSWPKDNNLGPVFNDFREDCNVWVNTDYLEPNYYGSEDLSKYRKIWWEREEKAFP